MRPGAGVPRAPLILPDSSCILLLSGPVDQVQGPLLEVALAGVRRGLVVAWVSAVKSQYSLEPYRREGIRCHGRIGMPPGEYLSAILLASTRAGLIIAEGPDYTAEDGVHDRVQRTWAAARLLGALAALRGVRAVLGTESRLPETAWTLRTTRTAAKLRPEGSWSALWPACIRPCP